MNVELLKERLDVREAELNEVRKEPYGYLKVMRRLMKIKRIRERIATRAGRKMIAERDEYFVGRLRKQVETAYRQLLGGQTRFMSIDVERTQEGHFQEVGITLIRGREMESFNYRVKGVGRGPIFLFGNTMEADVSIIKNLILLHAQSADVYLGHDIQHDLRHLEAEGIVIPNKFHYDTARMARTILGYTPSLYALTQQYGTAAQQFHCGGNDARYTAEVFVKMVHTHQGEI